AIAPISGTHALFYDSVESIIHPVKDFLLFCSFGLLHEAQAASLVIDVVRSSRVRSSSCEHMPHEVIGHCRGPGTILSFPSLRPIGGSDLDQIARGIKNIGSKSG